ncbi:MAG TPA: Smr/MutS family protein [Thermoanaerobaculia bacterium]|nr:Smr/MutS family protein [Thermoanaerobaculia bacterium]
MSEEASAAALELDRVLTLVALEAKTGPGRRALLARRPSNRIEVCNRLQGELAEMIRLIASEGLLPFFGLDEHRGLFERSFLDLEESWQIVRALRATQAVRQAVLRDRHSYPQLTARAEAIHDLGTTVAAAGRYFTRDGKLREDASAELRTIRSRVQTKRQSVQKHLSGLMQRHGAAVQEEIITLRADRYCIPVRAERRHEIPGILHERSGSGASVFIEPIEVVEMNNDLADLLLRERDEIHRILQHITGILIADGGRILESIDAAGELDAIQACAVLGQRIRATRPSFTELAEMHLIDARHPLLDESLADLRTTAFGEEESGSGVIPTTLHLTPDARALLISGPNAGGKTVTLKTAGLVTAMAASGLPVPAGEGTVVPVVDGIHLLVGDEQDVLEHVSTFSGYLRRLDRIVRQATPRSLVLLDELGSGTDPEEGAALGSAVIEHLLEQGTLLMVTSHLASLQTLALREPRIRNASMEFDPVTHTPTYRMLLGLPGRSRALETARRVGLPEGVIARAAEHLGSRYEETDALLAHMQKLMTSLLEERRAAEELRRDLDGELHDLREQRAALDREKRELARAWKDESTRLRQEVQRRLGQELEQLRRADRLQHQKMKTDPVATRILQPLLDREAMLPGAQGEISVGGQAEHRLYRVVGTVESIEGDRVEISVRGRKMIAARNDLVPVASGEGSQKKERGRSQPAQRVQSIDETTAPMPELNLIGQRIDEAIEECDRFLDRALLDGRAAVRLIHGHGSGRLRAALREHLRKHAGVRSSRPGSENEGGDGATVVMLDV